MYLISIIFNQLTYYISIIYVYINLLLIYFKDNIFFINKINHFSNIIDSELWDDWSNWSTCSVTCGSGRQVRWRHCSAEHCIKGLKRAQIKACHLKNGDSKDILQWLGIKSK